MDDYDFEHFVADLWERMGWQTEVSAQTADKGIDVVATRHSPYEEKALIQAKRYGPTTTVGSPDIQQYASLKQQRHGVDKVLVVTTNGFSKQAAEIAHQLNVKLVDGDDLITLLEEFDARDLVERYAPAIDEPEPATSPEPRVIRAPTGEAEPIDTLSATGEGIDSARTGDSWNEELTEREKSKGRLAGRLPAERWKWVAGATGAWVLGVALAGADGGLVMLVAWVGLPYAILKDGHWTRWRRWYAAAALLPVFSVFVGAWYLLMRWRAVGFESAGDDIERTDTTEERPREYHESESRGSDETDAYDHYTEAVEDIND